MAPKPRSTATTRVLRGTSSRKRDTARDSSHPTTVGEGETTLPDSVSLLPSTGEPEASIVGSAKHVLSDRSSPERPPKASRITRSLSVTPLPLRQTSAFVVDPSAIDDSSGDDEDDDPPIPRMLLSHVGTVALSSSPATRPSPVPYLENLPLPLPVTVPQPESVLDISPVEVEELQEHPSAARQLVSDKPATRPSHSKELTGFLATYDQDMERRRNDMYRAMSDARRIGEALAECRRDITASRF